MSAVLEASGLGKRYSRKWALSECTLIIPTGKVVGLVGPNGAGKTTLLQISVGLLRASAGSIAVLGSRPGTTPGQLARVGFVAQDTPTYAGLCRRSPPIRQVDEPGLGREVRPGPHRAPWARPETEGWQALRRSARPACTHPRRRQAT